MRVSRTSNVIDAVLLIAVAWLVLSIRVEAMQVDGGTPMLGIVALAWVVIRLLDGQKKFLP
ncbi:MAG: hypothetical protein J4F32_03800 [Dehalococcoidia bacterium]|nr:hypothetical protein [Dehalococcoidia bacterium]